MWDVFVLGRRARVKITVSATGSIDADRAWERYMNPDLWPQWAPQIQGVETEADRLSAGTRGTVKGPLGFAVDFEVDEVNEAAWTWSWHAWWQNRILGLQLEHGVLRTATGTKTWLTVHGTPPLVLPYLPVAQFALTRLVAP